MAHAEPAPGPCCDCCTQIERVCRALSVSDDECVVEAVERLAATAEQQGEWIDRLRSVNEELGGKQFKDVPARGISGSQSEGESPLEAR